MIQLTHRALATSTVALAFVAAVAAPAHAQYQPRPVPNPPTSGENYHVEGGINWWNPSADMTVTSGGTGALAGLQGTAINAKNDLGFVDKRVPEFQVFFRPGEGHKIRFQYVPINYDADSVFVRDIDFNGQRYRAGLPVQSSLDWKAYRFGYEYDFYRKESGFIGFITEVKYTDATVSLNSPIVAEFTQQRVAIPALGGIARVYVHPSVAITGELTLFKLPTIEDRFSGHYTDLDIYGTVNFLPNVGVQGGYRSLSLGFTNKDDNGLFVLKGMYFGFVGRF